jgi:hypothetical protein
MRIDFGLEISEVLAPQGDAGRVVLFLLDENVRVPRTVVHYNIFYIQRGLWRDLRRFGIAGTTRPLQYGSKAIAIILSDVECADCIIKPLTRLRVGEK